MKLAVLAQISNECDVIELFIRINARLVDHFFIADLSSSDATPLILQKMLEEGFPITRWLYPVNFQKGKIKTECLRRIAAEGDYDWVFLLDADEFLSGTRKELESQLSCLPSSICASLNLRTYVPTSDDYFQVDNPLYSLFRPKVVESKVVSKIAIPKSKLGTLSILMGSHGAREDGARAETTPIDCFLAHCPVRSPAQIIIKALLGSHQLSVTHDRLPGEGSHWDRMAQFIRGNGYRLSPEQFRWIALTYSLPLGQPSDDRQTDSPRIGLESDRIVYQELANIDLANDLPQRADAFMRSLCEQLTQCRNQASDYQLVLKQNRQLARAVKSAEQWQKSWLRRVLHRWRPPKDLRAEAEGS